MQLFRKEQHLPSNIIDRDSTRAWKAAGSLDTFGRAKLRVKELLASYTKPTLDEAKEEALHAFMLDLANKAGMDTLPVLGEYQPA
jgi:trimethylamine:corrinoid methyltransferase-like protein